MPKPLVIIDNLSKNFDKFKAVKGVSLSLNPGDIYALIGPNGAGKTTLTKMLVGLLSPTSGKASIAGYDISSSPLEAKKNFGYLPDNPSIYDHLNGYEFLSLTASLSGLYPKYSATQIQKLSQIFPIKEILGDRMGNYSRGNRQKVGFLSTLLAPHKVLIIDEPIVGLDPSSITIFGQTLKNFVSTGGCVFLVTHTLQFAQKYANRVGVMNEGKLVYEAPVSKVDLEKIYQSKTSDK